MSAPGGWDDRELRWRRRTAVEMAVSGVLGLIASLVLSIEAWRLAQDSSATFACDVSSVLSCSTVALTPQAQVFGFPNAFLGILFESVVLAISVALFAGVRFPRWYMLGANLLYTVALVFAYWLFSQSYFVIHALCPWCLLITATTTLVFAGLTRINVREGVIPAAPAVRRFVGQGLDWAITGLVLFVIAAMLVAGYGVDLLS
ncbi:vitamin K epoxide reductase family protein [Actinomyces sp. B33]|uniref:vitamin K epoxide reductase family protein n=1 Tax=Actinomyces sp. B33 TaxID=2942131 RepID=UPI0023401C5C|nr:vitamin K epoxide reductase family protein [Actinomyces sp. B33]MDC4233322.1 vitamin K epoxide reductase family protein [Actinomyces sp. B33]